MVEQAQPTHGRRRRELSEFQQVSSCFQGDSIDRVFDISETRSCTAVQLLAHRLVKKLVFSGPSSHSVLEVDGIVVSSGIGMSGSLDQAVLPEDGEKWQSRVRKHSSIVLLLCCCHVVAQVEAEESVFLY